MNEQYGFSQSDWDLKDWENALTINVGTAYVCRDCENLVMVTRGGVGVLDLQCCGKKMERVECANEQRGDKNV